MLLDAVRHPSPGSALAAEPPAQLVDGDLVAAFVLGARQLERRGERRTTAADNGDP